MTEPTVNIDTSRLTQAVEDLRAKLGGGLLATDIWERHTGVSLAAHNHQPAAVDLFNKVANDLRDALAASGFPGLNRYYLLDLESDKAVLVLRHGDDILQGMLLDTRHTNMGVALSLGLRTAFDGVQQARR